ncbi:MAG: hypothetical protein ACP5R5_09180 [Armatimonadota bacterium]
MVTTKRFSDEILPNARGLRPSPIDVQEVNLEDIFDALVGLQPELAR